MDKVHAIMLFVSVAELSADGPESLASMIQLAEVDYNAKNLGYDGYEVVVVNATMDPSVIDGILDSAFERTVVQSLHSVYDRDIWSDGGAFLKSFVEQYNRCAMKHKRPIKVLQPNRAFRSLPYLYTDG